MARQVCNYSLYTNHGLFNSAAACSCIKAATIAVHRDLLSSYVTYWMSFQRHRCHFETTSVIPVPIASVSHFLTLLFFSLGRCEQHLYATHSSSSKKPFSQASRGSLKSSIDSTKSECRKKKRQWESGRYCQGNCLSYNSTSYDNIIDTVMERPIPISLFCRR